MLNFQDNFEFFQTVYAQHKRQHLMTLMVTVIKLNIFLWLF